MRQRPTGCLQTGLFYKRAGGRRGGGGFICLCIAHSVAHPMARELKDVHSNLERNAPRAEEIVRGEERMS